MKLPWKWIGLAVLGVVLYLWWKKKQAADAAVIGPRTS